MKMMAYCLKKSIAFCGLTGTLCILLHLLIKKRRIIQSFGRS
ncbi:putative methyltransferase PMT7 [Iris pallida]|uniref:Methyltransferase PMT7 n=1 Tax=Iris pallida TaxID=29817 RepID=A0AAX6HC70_IRIPA|nr:putative methyltransferase PMT7 [Iris pallida]